MFGLNEALMSFIRRQVGLRTDVASASGSLHAKIADLRTYIANQIATVQNPRGAPMSGYYSFSSSGSYVTALHVTGRGKLLGLALRTHNNSGATGYLQLTIDETFILNVQLPQSGAETKYWYPTPGFLFGVTHAEDLFFTDPQSGSPRNAEVSFKSSLKVEIQNPVGNGIVYWLYEKE